VTLEDYKRVEQTHVLYRGSRTETLKCANKGVPGSWSSARVIKQLRPFADVAEERHSLFVEAALQAHLQGPGVPAVLTRGLPAISAQHPPKGELNAFEQVHVSGRTLFEVCASHETTDCLDLEMVASWIFQLCEIVARLHRATDLSGKKLRLMHRDITPHNVILEGPPHDPLCRIWLIDFGISHCESWGPLNPERFMQGTPSYRPPEVSRGKAPSPASDIYQVALCARHALQGIGPPGKSWLAALAPQPLDRPSAQELAGAFTKHAELIG